MKKTSIIMAPLFAAVVVLLSIGTAGELIANLFAKVKNILTATSTDTQGSSQESIKLTK